MNHTESPIPDRHTITENSLSLMSYKYLFIFPVLSSRIVSLIFIYKADSAASAQDACKEQKQINMRVRVTVFDLHLLFLSQCQSQTAIIFPTRMSSLCHARKAKPVNLHHLRPMELQAQDPMHQSSTKSYRSWSIS